MTVMYSYSLGHQEIYCLRSRSLDQSSCFLSTLPVGGPVVYFRLNLCSGLNISIVHMAQSVILDSCAVVQGLELCKHTSPVGMLPRSPWSKPTLCQIKGARGYVDTSGGCETTLLLLQCIHEYLQS